MTIERVRRLAFRTISQIGIRYRRSRLSLTLAGLPDGAPVGGERFPWLQLKTAPGGAAEDLFDKLDDTRFNLLVIGQPAPSAGALGALVSIYAVPGDAGNAAELARAGIKGAAFYLVRPDGFVGLAGSRLDLETVKRYLTERLVVDRACFSEKAAAERKF
jgi:hypothetical protein